jgi:hypothetical protein
MLANTKGEDKRQKTQNGSLKRLKPRITPG